MAVDLIPCINQNVEARYWAKVDVRGEDECWPWLGSTCNGYGQFGIKLPDGRNMPKRASHVSLAIAGKRPGKFRLAMHSCDNRICVNPKHLKWATHKANTADMVAKGRTNPAPVRGERNHLAKLTPDIVIAIRREIGSPARIGLKYGVNRSCVHKIKTRQSWKHVA